MRYFPLMFIDIHTSGFHQLRCQFYNLRSNESYLSQRVHGVLAMQSRTEDIQHTGGMKLCLIPIFTQSERHSAAKAREQIQFFLRNYFLLPSLFYIKLCSVKAGLDPFNQVQI